MNLRAPPGAFHPPRDRAIAEATAPPIIPAPAAKGVYPGGEVFIDEINTPTTETLVYQTVQQWRAVDVYLQPKSNLGSGGPAGLSSTGVLTARIYARLPGGVRLLVATGRIGRLPSTVARGLRFPAWVAAARAQTTGFDVTLEYRQTPAGGSGRIGVILVATNEANEPPRWLGSIPSSFNPDTALSTQTVPDAELLYVQGAPMVGVAAPRFLQIFDAGNPVVAGDRPTFQFPICGAGGAPAGPGHWEMSYRAKSAQMNFFVSSTADVLTQVLDCQIQAVVR